MEVPVGAPEVKQIHGGQQARYVLVACLAEETVSLPLWHRPLPGPKAWSALAAQAGEPVGGLVGVALRVSSGNLDGHRCLS